MLSMKRSIRDTKQRLCLVAKLSCESEYWTIDSIGWSILRGELEIQSDHDDWSILPNLKIGLYFEVIHAFELISFHKFDRSQHIPKQ